MKPLVLVMVGLLVAVAFSVPARAAVFQVSPGADGDCSDLVCGLQAALTAAQSNGEDDTINVAAGTYDADGAGATFTYVSAEDRTLSIIGAGAESTILESSGNLRRVLHLDARPADGGNSHITVRGLTLRNGSDSFQGGGCAAWVTTSEVEIRHCVFSGNGAFLAGGGLYLWADLGRGVVGSSTFVNNSAVAWGGGLFAETTTGEIWLLDNLFDANMNPFSGGGAHVQTNSGFVQMALNTIRGNACLGVGCGAYVKDFGAGKVVFENTIVFGNHGATSGGGLLADSVSGQVEILNNLFYENTAILYGGGVHASAPGGTGIVLVNNTVSANDAGTQGGGVVLRGSGPPATFDVYNNIIRGNVAPAAADLLIEDDTDSNSTYVATKLFNNNLSDYQIIPGGALTQGSNMNVDPQFVDPPGGDYRLAERSPCVEAGDTNAPGLRLIDLDREKRLLDGNGDGIAVVDMGAYETLVSVAPWVGTIGTLVTLSNSGPFFGEGKPKVYLNVGGKRKSFRVVDYSPDLIHALWTKKVDPGVYNVEVRPKDKNAATLIHGTFEVAVPSAQGVAPGNGTPGNTATVSGRFFGSKKPRVFLTSGIGLSKLHKCRVQGYTMVPETGASEAAFVVPNLLPGLYDVIVQSKVGQSPSLLAGFEVQ